MRATTLAVAAVLALSITAWAGPGAGKHGVDGQKKDRPNAAWKQGSASDSSTTCPATRERKHKREHKRQQSQTQQQSAQPAGPQENQ